MVNCYRHGDTCGTLMTPSEQLRGRAAQIPESELSADVPLGGQARSAPLKRNHR